MPPPIGREMNPAPTPDFARPEFQQEQFESNMMEYKSIIDNVEEGVAGMRMLLAKRGPPLRPNTSTGSNGQVRFDGQPRNECPGSPFIETSTGLPGKSEIHIPHHLSQAGTSMRNPVSGELNLTALDGKTWNSPSFLSIGEPGFENEQAARHRRLLLESIDNALMAAARGEDEDEEDDEESIQLQQTLSSVKSRFSPVFGKPQVRKVGSPLDPNIAAIWMVATLKRIRRKHFMCFWSKLKSLGEIESRKKATLQMRQLARPLLICQAKSSALALGHGIRTKHLAQLRTGLRALDENIAYQVMAHAQMEHDDFADLMEKKRQDYNHSLHLLEMEEKDVLYLEEQNQRLADHIRLMMRQRCAARILCECLQRRVRGAFRIWYANTMNRPYPFLESSVIFCFTLRNILDSLRMKALSEPFRKLAKHADDTRYKEAFLKSVAAQPRGAEPDATRTNPQYRMPHPDSTAVRANVVSSVGASDVAPYASASIAPSIPSEISGQFELPGVDDSATKSVREIIAERERDNFDPRMAPGPSAASSQQRRQPLARFLPRGVDWTPHAARTFGAEHVSRPPNDQGSF